MCLRILVPRQEWDRKWKKWRRALGSNNSDAGRDVLINGTIKCLLHCLLKAVKCIIDAPEANFHSILSVMLKKA